jgi:UDP-N-acetylmuramoylalanine--D-glutamate ligase
VGNIGTPLVTAVGAEVDVVVAEVSSFQLELTTSAWRPRVAALLNIADDHLDWHGGRDAYAAAKARIFANQRDDDVLVVNADDGAAATVAQHAPANRIDVGDDGAAVLRTRAGVDLLDAHELPRALPHDRTNSLVAAEVALAAGASVDAVRSVLREYRTLPHRVQLVADANGVGWYDDSKATNPHATVRAIAAFDSVVLCAGGRNKELDLSGLAADLERIRAVVAFGEAAPEVVAAFAGRRPVVVATDMDLVVQRAAELARTGDAVLLSPACASFDWYANYGERGDDFARAVRAHLETMEAVS